VPAELIIQDFGGLHNAHPDATRARLIKGASWKRQRIIVILPAAAMIPAKVALSHWNLMFPPNNGVLRILAQGMEVGDAYSSAIEQVLAHPELSQWEYVLSIEHDNAPPPDGVLRLLEQMEAHPEFACIGGLYFTKGAEHSVAQCWGDPKDPVLNFRPQIPIPGQLLECCGTGMGFNLWRMEMFKDQRIRRPLFRTVAGKEGIGTQDLSFWTEARKYGYRCAVDCSVLVGHYDASSDIMW
jgi:hypothetical protein